MHTVSFAELDRKVPALAKRLTSDAALQQDLFQEIRFFLWQTLESTPDQTVSWYTQRGFWHGQNYLKTIRAFDERLDLEEISQEPCPSISPQNHAEGVDLVGRIKAALTPLQRKVLDFLVEGFSIMDIARKLDVNHAYVSRQRTAIQRAYAML